MEIISHSVEETRAVGARIARAARPVDVFALVGELGCGKTELARGFVIALCGEAPVRSPTFSIVNTYEGPEFPIYHFDFYRLKRAAELIEIGYGDYINGCGVCLIEWADMFPEVLPPRARTVRLEDRGGNVRRIVVEGELTPSSASS